MRFALILALLSSAATAETPMTGDEFEAYVTGKILTYESAGDPSYGVEQYLPKRRVRWSAFDGTCLKGEWYPDPPNICFAYVDHPDPHCWTVFKTPNGIQATETVSGQVIFEGQEDPSALVCGDLFS